MFPCGSSLASSFLITEQSKKHRLPWTQERLEITWGSTGRLISLIAQRNEISFLSMLWVWRNSTLSWNLPGFAAECMQCVCLSNVFSKVIYFCFLFFFSPFFFFPPERNTTRQRCILGCKERKPGSPPAAAEQWASRCGLQRQRMHTMHLQPQHSFCITFHSPPYRGCSRDLIWNILKSYGISGWFKTFSCR